ncbi:MAG TPA: 6-carboxytetrahydropterin synthase [Gemmatimonadales bacterium]|jgi:6-pyruvoyltetrahydropterin/6-carboxytetrahydropterin synthase|nr:6-carboxytetrahydropterin synthase [Gemmatimonadales bacterium]
MRSSLTRTVAFRASHRFFKPGWSEPENRARFGWTADAPGHSHDYTCAVTVSGSLDPETDMILDLPLLDRILADEVAGPLNGKHLNEAVPEFAYGRALPTCEALARYLFGRIAARLPEGVTLDLVRVAEDATLHADCERDEGSGVRDQGRPRP